MSASTVAQLRAAIYTVQSDSELEGIISLTTSILSGQGISSTNARYNELHLYKSVIMCLERMQTNSELPYMSKLGSVQQMNSDIVSTIDRYQKKYEDVLKSINVVSGLQATYKISGAKTDVYYER